MLKTIQTLLVSLLTFSSFLVALPVTTAQATRAGDTSLEEQCFNTLKQEIADNDLFIQAWPELSTLEYADISPQYTGPYRNMSSFGIDLDQPLFSTKIYSFGRQTGYTHPSFSVFPSTQLSDTWSEPVKEFVILEEYVTNPAGDEQFLSCGFTRIDSDNLSDLNAETYFSDGTMTDSLISKNDQYATWYNTNDSYDTNNNLIATWQRLFVYPATTQNSYFSRYTVIDALPGRTAPLSVLTDGLIPVIQTAGEARAELTAILAGDLNDQMKDIMQNLYDSYEGIPDDEIIFADYTLDPDTDIFADLPDTSPTSTTDLDLTIYTLDPANENFFFNTYYQVIENTFPEFASHLSVRGVLPYTAVKAILADTPEADQYAEAYKLVSNRDLIDLYALSKKTGTRTADDLIPMFENYLTQLQDIQTKIETDLAAPTPTTEPTTAEVSTLSSTKLILATLVLIFFIALVGWILKKDLN